MSMSDHDIIAAGLSLGTGVYMARWVLTDLIVGLFEVIGIYKTQKDKIIKKPPAV